MPIIHRGKRWEVSIGSGKQRIRQSFDTEAEARKYVLEVTLKKLGATQQQTTGSIGTTLGMLKTLTAVNIWVNSRSNIKLQANAQLVIDHLGEDLNIKEINAEKIRGLMKHFTDLGNSGGTINRKMSTL